MDQASHGLPPGAPAASPAVRPHRPGVVLALMSTAGGLVVVDAASLFVALPSIAADLSVSATGVQWIVTAYLVTFGGLLLTGGRTADIVGRRRVFLASLALLVGASLVCGLAPDLQWLVAGRAAQGVAAAFITPAAQSILTTTFTEDAERNRALGVWGAVGAFGAAGGAVVGGPVTQLLGWEWVFLLNVPLGLALLVLAPRYVTSPPHGSAERPLDLPGGLTIAAALASLVVAVVQGPEWGWTSGRTIGLATVAVALVVMFVQIEARSADPLVPLQLLRAGPHLGGNLVMLSIGAGAAGVGLILTQYAQGVLEYTPTQYALVDGLFAVLTVGGSFAGQALVTRVGLAWAGLVSMGLITAGSAAFVSVSVNGTFLADLLPGVVLFAPGLGAAFVVASIAALSRLPDEIAGVASGVNNTAFHVGGAVGLALLGSVAVTGAGTTEASGDPLAAVTRGYQWAFAAAVVFAVAGVLTVALLRSRNLTRDAADMPDPVPIQVPVPIPVPAPRPGSVPEPLWLPTTASVGALTVARFGDLVVVTVRSSRDAVDGDRLGGLWHRLSTAASEGRQGRDLAQLLVTSLSHGTEPVVPALVAVAVDTRGPQPCVAALAHGRAVLDVYRGREQVRLDGRCAVTVVGQVLSGPVTRIEATVEDVPGIVLHMQSGTPPQHTPAAPPGGDPERPPGGTLRDRRARRGAPRALG